MRYWCFFVVLVCLCSFSQTEFVNTIYTAVLSPQSVVPVHSDTGGLGTAVCVYKRNDNPITIDCEVQFYEDSKYGPFYSGIYRGDETQNGELLYEFEVKIDSNFRQKFVLENKSFLSYLTNETYTTKQQESDFLNGKWYILITSPDYPFGNIRGQILHEHFMYARLENNDVVPPINEIDETHAHGLAVGSYTYYNPKKTASFVLVHDVEGANAIRLNEGKIGEIGATDYSFSDVDSPVREDVPYYSTTEERLLEDEQYLEIYSLGFPRGEVRGQLQTIDQLPAVSFTSRLDGLSVRPDHVSTYAKGCGLFSLDCSTFRLEYLVYHSVHSPTSAWMNLGDRYSNGVKIWPLARAEGPIYGSRLLTADEIVAFYQQRLYVTIESLIYPDGEIRGQIADTYTYYAYLTGTQLLPPKTTSAIGCATLRMNEVTNRGRILDFDVHFGSPDYKEFSVDLLHGDIGTEGEFMYNLGSTYGSLSNNNVFLSNTEVNYVGNENTYIQVGDPALAGGRGILRGQVYHIRNPCPFLTSLPDDNPKTPTSSWDKYELPTYIEWNSSSHLIPLLSIIVLLLVVLV